MNVYAISPTNLGFIKLWPANSSEPSVSTVNYQIGVTAVATGTIVPVRGRAHAERFGLVLHERSHKARDRRIGSLTRKVEALAAKLRTQ